MGFIKHALIGIAVYETIKYLRRKDEFGRTKLEEIKDQATEWVDKAKAVAADTENDLLPRGL